MKVEGGKIVSVTTNKGVIYPKIVINAAGVHADQIAEMAGDRTFTIHPRRGTDIITDKKAGYMVRTSMAKAPFSILPQDKSTVRGVPFGKIRLLINSFNGSSHTKGVMASSTPSTAICSSAPMLLKLLQGGHGHLQG